MILISSPVKSFSVTVNVELVILLLITVAVIVVLTDGSLVTAIVIFVVPAPTAVITPSSDTVTIASSSTV